MKINIEIPEQALLIEIPQQEQLVVEECDGTGLLGLNSPVPTYNDPSWLKSSHKTGATNVSIYGVNEFPRTPWVQESFLSLRRDLDSLCMTQHQIKRFVEKALFGSSHHFCLKFLSRFGDRYGIVDVVFYGSKYSVNETKWCEGSDFGFPGGDSAPHAYFIVVPSEKKPNKA